MDQFTQGKLPFYGECVLDGFDGPFHANAYGPIVCHISGRNGFSIESHDACGPNIWANVPTVESRFQGSDNPTFYYS